MSLVTDVLGKQDLGRSLAEHTERVLLMIAPNWNNCAHRLTRRVEREHFAERLLGVTSPYRLVVLIESQH